MSISRKGWLGLAKEATPGTAIATPTLFLPSKSKFKQQTKFAYVDEDRGTRDVNNQRIATVQQSVGSSSGSWYNDASPYLLLAFMGTDTPSQPASGTDPTVWSHAFALADTPPTLTVFRSFDYATYSMAYCMVSKLKLSFSADNKTFQCAADLQGLYGTKMGSPPTPAFSNPLPFSGLQAVIQLTGVQSTDISEMDIELDQKFELWYSAGSGQAFLKQYPGDRSAKISFKARFDNDTLYNKYFNTPPTDDHINVVISGQTISHTYAQSLTLDFPIVGYDDFDLTTDKVNVMLDAKATARPGATLNSLFTATVQNTVAAYTV
jgi:hypothetical protein